MNYGRIERAPDLTGAFGAAWQLPVAPLGQRRRADLGATIAGWLLNAPQAHPLWTYYLVSVIHLHAIAGVKPPFIRTPGATHELIIASLNPEQRLPDLAAVGRGEASFAFLTPIDVMEQFTVTDDAMAYRLCELAVRSCVDGIASPDQDWRSWWRATIANTAQHLRDGVHTEGRH